MNWLRRKHGGSRTPELSGQKLKALLQGVDSIICGAVRMTREVIENGLFCPQGDRPTGRGVRHSRRASGEPKVKVVVTITPGTVEEGVADHVFALMLAAAKRVIEGHQCMLKASGKPTWALRYGGRRSELLAWVV